jgi:hypothetical protein
LQRRLLRRLWNLYSSLWIDESPAAHKSVVTGLLFTTASVAALPLGLIDDHLHHARAYVQVLE